MPDDAPQGPEEVHRKVRDAILTGELEPGAVMSQLAVAESLGVTRSPLREALRRLQEEGLIHAEPGRRVRVAPLGVSDLEELWIVRVTLEAEAVRLSIPLLTPEDIAGLEGEVAVMEHFARTRDFPRWSVPHRRFHRLLTRPAGSRINALLGQLFDHAERYHHLHFGAGPGPGVKVSHRDIVDACIARDRERAPHLLVDHLAQPAFELGELLDRDHALTRLHEAVRDAGGQ